MRSQDCEKMHGQEWKAPPCGAALSEIDAVVASFAFVRQLRCKQQILARVISTNYHFTLNH